MSDLPGEIEIVILEDGREAAAVELVVPKDVCGRLDNWLTGRLERYSRGRVQRIIKSGHLTIDGQVVTKSSHQLRGRETIRFLRPLPVGEGPIPPVEVVAQQESLLVVNKPGDLTLHPTANALRRTLTTWLYREGLGRYCPAHRLDRETSGLVVCAPKGEPSRELKNHFLDHRVRKGYLALVKGGVTASVTIDAPLGDDEGPILIKQGVTPNGAPSQTRFVPLVVGSRATLVMALPMTGRQHQIRVHAEVAGYPLWGDKLYGVPPEVFLTFIGTGLTPELLERLSYPRQMLHAAFLVIPSSAGAQVFYAHPPADFCGAADDLGVPLPEPEQIRARFEQELRMVLGPTL